MLCKQNFLFFTYVQMYICLYVILTSTFLRDTYNQFKIRSIFTSTLNYWKNDRAILTEQQCLHVFNAYKLLKQLRNKIIKMQFFFFVHISKTFPIVDFLIEMNIIKCFVVYLKKKIMFNVIDLIRKSIELFFVLEYIVNG